MSLHTLHCSQCHKFQFNSVPQQFCNPPHFVNLLCHLASLSPSITMPHSYFGPLEDHSPPHESSQPLFVRACIFFWTLATMGAITCDPLGRSHRMIVQTLDDVTPVTSVTLMRPLRHTACMDGTTAVVPCSTLQHARDRFPLLRRGTQHVTCTADHRVCASHSSFPK